MAFFLNELSLHGQYANVADLKKATKVIWQCGIEINKRNDNFYCHHQLSSSPATHNLNFKEAILQTRDTNFIRTVLNWIAKSGPFWEDKRFHSEDDWLEDESKEIITGSSLAEAAWRTTQGKKNHTISFEPSQLFNKAPLEVIWKRSDEDEQVIEVKNFWQIDSLKDFLKNDKNNDETSVNTWQDLIRQCIQQYTNLTFTDDVMPKNIAPFSKGFAEKIKELLAILDELNVCFEKNGSLNQCGQKIIQDHFQGDKALFTDESKPNKRKYKKELTFKKPGGEEISCPFHGKIKFGREFRIHFNWPKEEPTEPLYIVYIGPKITKH
ncbi:hypothetical protein [Candidatus Parabeggiatoa sp. HSG14]|uniref:hypothetical protein n=1 Tax=Candidatus Parabeggiatoa sp. HSG14 TaxID=3055593 RepID=UPI0025A69D38|nr:hypothetical protein [Thiotrichales bacterium HSG14]